MLSCKHIQLDFMLVVSHSPKLRTRRIFGCPLPIEFNKTGNNLYLPGSNSEMDSFCGCHAHLSEFHQIPRDEYKFSAL